VSDNRRKVHEGKAKIVWDAWPASGAAGSLTGAADAPGPAGAPGGTPHGARVDTAGNTAAVSTDAYLIEFKNDATAFDGKKRGRIGGKGRCNNLISAILFELLEREGVRTHYIKTLSDTEMLARKVDIIQVEVIVRNVAAGSLAKRLGLEEGTVLDHTVLELCYKSDELGDPMINRHHVKALGLATDEEMDHIEAEAFRVNDILGRALEECGLRLIDFKLEFGRTAEGEILLADEISPDTCRFWDVSSGDRLDKDRFRRDMGKVEEAYDEVLRRVTEAAEKWRAGRVHRADTEAGEAAAAATRGRPTGAAAGGRARVFVTLKSTVLDPQGAAVQKALRSMGYGEVDDVRVGKFIVLELEDASPERVDEMSRRLLANPVIEDYAFEIDRPGGKS